MMIPDEMIILANMDNIGHHQILQETALNMINTEKLKQLPPICQDCNQSIDYNFLKGKRKDVEICIETFDGKLKGMLFCSNECFNEYWTKILKNQVKWDIPKEEFVKCSSCKESIRDYPTYTFIPYGKSKRYSKMFCSDKCLRFFIKSSVKKVI